MRRRPQQTHQHHTTHVTLHIQTVSSLESCSRAVRAALLSDSFGSGATSVLPLPLALGPSLASTFPLVTLRCLLVDLYQDQVVLCSALLSPQCSAWPPAPAAEVSVLLLCRSTPPQQFPSPALRLPRTLARFSSPLAASPSQSPASHLRPLSLRPAVELLRFLPAVSTVASQALPLRPSSSVAASSLCAAFDAQALQSP